MKSLEWTPMGEPIPNMETWSAECVGASFVLAFDKQAAAHEAWSASAKTPKGTKTRWLGTFDSRADAVEALEKCAAEWKAKAQ